MDNKSITVYDVAKKCGVSPATASRVLSNSSYKVSEKLRERVVTTAKEMGYQVNMLGRFLKSKASNEIGVIVPSLLNDSYIQLITGINNVLLTNGYTVSLNVSNYNVNIEKQQIMSLAQRWVCGIIVVPTASDYTWVNDTIAANVPVVLVGKESANDWYSIYYDSFEGGCIAAEYLAKLGHKRIAVIGSHMTDMNESQLIEGFTKTLEEKGLKIPDPYIRIADGVRTEGMEGMFSVGRNLVNNLILNDLPPTAIFCTNDTIAFGAIYALNYAHYSVPGDISVIGFGNSTFSRMTVPNLTTVDALMSMLGAQAAEKLQECLQNPDYQSEPTILKPRLVPRASTRSLSEN